MASEPEKRDEMAEEKYLEEKPSTIAGPSTHDAALTRKILLKLDIRYNSPALSSSSASNTNKRRILPILALLFLCSFLDRTNVGNAKTYGLEASLKMTDLQYDTGLAVFYATYIARYVFPRFPRFQRFPPSCRGVLVNLAWN